jgi:putative membrane protein
MRKFNVLFTVLVGSMCVFQSCNKDDDENYAMSDQEFVIQAASSNRLEISAGELAINRGQMDTVKAYGQRMIAEHTMAQNELVNIAAAQSIPVPDGYLSHHANNLNVLGQFTGTQFDIKFAELMVISHQEAVIVFRRAAQPDGVPDPELRNWAASKLPSLEKHLMAAEALYVTVTQTPAN